MHWLGLNKISADTNSIRFMDVWQLPETKALLAQTLDKLSRQSGGRATNAANALLRPLLDDLISSESYLEIYAGTNLASSTRQAQILLAVRLPADHADQWETNLAAALEALTGDHPVFTRHSWWLQQSRLPDRVEVSRSGEWTLVGLGRASMNCCPDLSSALLTNTPRPPPISGSKLISICRALLVTSLARHSTLNSRLSINCTLPSQARLAISLPRATLNCSRMQDLPLPPWEIPTNFIHSSLTSFTAMRGFASWLARLPAWQKLQLTPPPDQAFFWAQEGVPFLTYFAAPLTAASNQLSQLAGHLIQNANPWLVINGEGSFQWQTNPPGIAWNGALFLSPCLKPIRVNNHDYVIGGLYPPPTTDSNLPPAKIPHPVFGLANLIYYQSEQTGQRVEDGQFINQLFRILFHKPQLPGTAVAALWLKNVAPLLGGSTTIVTRTGSQQFTFTRHSTIGFTALELHLLASWLESPQFPRWCFSIITPNLP